MAVPFGSAGAFTRMMTILLDPVVNRTDTVFWVHTNQTKYWHKRRSVSKSAPLSLVPSNKVQHSLLGSSTCDSRDVIIGFTPGFHHRHFLNDFRLREAAGEAEDEDERNDECRDRVEQRLARQPRCLAAAARKAAGLPPTRDDEEDDEESETDAELGITDDSDVSDYRRSDSYSNWY